MDNKDNMENLQNTENEEIKEVTENEELTADEAVQADEETTESKEEINSEEKAEAEKSEDEESEDEESEDEESEDEESEDEESEAEESEDEESEDEESEDEEESEDDSNQKNKKRKIILIIAACAVVVIAAVTAIVLSNTLCSTGGSNNTATSDEAVTEENIKTFDIDLGFVVLKYPERWKDAVTITGAEAHKAGDSFTVAFAKGENKLFDLYFNSSEGNILGTIKKDDSQTVLSVKTYKLNSNDKDLPLMQEDLNVIIENLKKDYDFSEGAVPDFNNTDVFEIKTNVVPLYYPKKWEDKVQVKVENNTVKFIQNNAEVFDVCFGQEDKGTVIGFYGDTPISVFEYKAKTDEQKEMKEDINVIIANLKKDPKFEEV